MNRIRLARVILTQTRLMAHNTNNSNLKQSEIHLSKNEIFSEEPLGILSRKGYTLMILNGALETRLSKPK